MKIGIIGYGEVGTAFARDLRANGAARSGVRRPVREFRGEAGPRREGRGRAGIRAAPNLQSVIDGAAFVFSAVTASAVEAVAAEAAQFLTAGQVFLDLNSASPATKRRAAVLVAASGADYVEGAVMAPIAEPRLRVPILGGGPAAARTADALNALGMNIRTVSEDIGKASAMKLCRSIMIKGFEALIIDCAAASRAWDVQDEVYASLTQTFPSIDWPKLAEIMSARVKRHGKRRAAEMREAGDMMADLGFDSGLCRAIADRHDAHAK